MLFLKFKLNKYFNEYYDENDDKEAWFEKIKSLSEELGYCSNMKEFPDKIIFQLPYSNENIYPTCSDIPKREMSDAPYVAAIGYSNGLFKVFSIS